MTRNKALALIHIAKKELGLRDDEYRVLLESCCGVKSAKDITMAWQYGAVLEAMRTLGWHDEVRSRPMTTKDPDCEVWGTASEAQCKKIMAMWNERARNPSIDALRIFICRTAGISHERFLNKELASKVIVGLCHMPITYKQQREENYDEGV